MVVAIKWSSWGLWVVALAVACGEAHHFDAAEGGQGGEHAGSAIESAGGQAAAGPGVAGAGAAKGPSGQGLGGEGGGDAGSDCDVDPCENGGICRVERGVATCECPDSFEGTYCETSVDDCAPAPCENKGTCVDRDDGYACTCPAGFSGVNCEREVSGCADEPCLNGAQCSDAAGGGYLCTCLPGYSGTNCELDIDDCASTPCQNGALCKDGVDQYTCECKAGFTGTHCETNVDDCAGSPCKNGGTCEDGIDAYSCECATGFTGTTCQTNINDCKPNACLNGGTCSDGIDSYTCSCTDLYTGDACEFLEVKLVPTSFTTDETTASAVSNDGSVVTFNIQHSGSTDSGRIVDFASVVGINGPNISFTSLSTRGIDKDGATIVGNVDSAPFKTVGNGGQVLSLSPFVTDNPPSASAYDVSSDGTAIVGVVYSGTYYAFYCKGGSCREASFLDTANHEITTAATSVSADGSVVAGYGSPVDPMYIGRAWRWTPADGKSTSLKLLAGTWRLPEARAISSNGNVIVGSVHINGVRHAVRWTGASGTATDLGLGIALGTNSDGTVIVGADNSDAAIVWSGSVGSTPTRKTLGSILGSNSDLTGATLVEAVAVSDDGKVVAATAKIGGKKRALMARLP